MKKIDKQSIVSNLIIFMAIVVFINLISLNIFFRIDLSKGKIYSLSSASKNTLIKLDDRIIVKAYFSKELPPHLASVQRYTRDLLEEYKRASKGKFKYEFITPNDDDKRREAMQSGIYPNNEQFLEKDRFEIREVFLGLVFEYNGKVETIPYVQGTRGLEYSITKTMNKIAAISTNKIAFFGLTPDIPQDPRQMWFLPQQQDKYQKAKTDIREDYLLVETNLDTPIPSDVSMLLFSGVVDSLTIEQLYNLDQFLMSGRSIIAFQSRVLANLNEQTAQPIFSNIFDLLAHYGVNIVDNLVMDSKCGQVSVSERRGIFTVNTPVYYPFLPVVNDVNFKNPITKQLGNIQFLFVSEIDTLSIPADIYHTPLLLTSNQTGSVTGPYYDIRIDRFMDRSFINRLTEKRKVLSSLYEGKFTSYFADKKHSFKDMIAETYTGKIIIVPDMEFITTSGGGQNENNMNFLKNSIDYLSDNHDIMVLRSREVINKPLEIEKLVKTEGMIPSDAEKKVANMRNFIKYTNIFLPFILLIIFGFIRYQYENIRRQKIRNIYE